MTNKSNETLMLFLDEKQAAIALRINPHSLRQSRQTGLLWGEPAPKYLKIGNRVRYRPSDLEDWLNQLQVQESTSQATNGQAHPHLLTETQVAEIYNIKANTLRVARQTGLLWGEPAPKYLKIGNRVRYRPSDLEDWLNQFQVQGNTSQDK